MIYNIVYQSYGTTVVYAKRRYAAHDCIYLSRNVEN